MLQNLKFTRFTKGTEAASCRIKGRRIIDLEYFGSQFEALAKIMTHLNITEDRILNYSMTTVSGIDYIYTRKRISENLKVIEDKLCRSVNGKKNCESGLNYRYLQTAHQRDITNGIRAILTEKMENGKVRVTNRKHINSILNHFNGR